MLAHRFVVLLSALMPSANLHYILICTVPFSEQYHLAGCTLGHCQDGTSLKAQKCNWVAVPLLQTTSVTVNSSFSSEPVVDLHFICSSYKHNDDMPNAVQHEN